MKNFIFLVPVIIIMIFGFSSVTNAYHSTNQQAYTLDNKTSYHVIDFVFGHTNNDIYIPVSATNSTNHTNNALSYEIMNDEGEKVRGLNYGIVLSDAERRGDFYFIPKGVRKSFSLFVSFTIDERDIGANYTVGATHLPFIFNNTQQLQLNPGELQYYKTLPLWLTP